MRWGAVGAVLVVGLLAIGVGSGQAQRIFAGFYGTTPPRFPNANSFQGGFTFCRAMFSSNRREKRGWDTDYPGADINFSIRLAELTKTRTARQTSGTDPDLKAITGVPHAIASIMTRPNGSGQSIGKSTAAAPARNCSFFSSLTSPVSWT